MIAESQTQGPRAVATPPRQGNRDIAEGSDVLVFLGRNQKDVAALQHAQNVARAFSGQVVLFRFMTPRTDGTSPIDPVDWDIKKRSALKCLERFARSLEKKGESVEARLLEGQCADQISACMDSRKGDIAAALRSRDDGRWRLSDTLSGVLNSPSAAILMIPEAAEKPARRGIRRILVPIDGSARSESALPRAVALAKAGNAELVLCYVTPEPGLTEFGVMDSKAIDLNREVTKRNTIAGRAHLNRITNSLAHHKLKISTLVVPGGDARRALIDTAAQEGADFLVMATHGQSGHGDVPTGDVASFILDRADIPVLMVRHVPADLDRHATGTVSSAGIRQPSGTGA